MCCRAAIHALALLACATPAASSPPAPLAFPGAQGFGAEARGGRGGDVYHVTRLDDGGPGTLRDAVTSAWGPRTVVFEVGGTIDLASPLVIEAAGLTIAGQTAPGGIGVRGYPVVVKHSVDLVIRYLRIRPGDIHAAGVRGRPGRGNADLDGAAADALSIVASERVIVDHVSAAWSMDETLSVSGSNDVTVQHSIIGESLDRSFHPEGRHGYGSLLRGRGGGGYTFFGNLYTHHYLRSPAVGGEQYPEPDAARRGLDLDFTNNVIYDWGLFASHTLQGLGRVRVNYVANVLVAGPSTVCTRCVFLYFDPLPGDALSIFQEGNRVDPDRDGSLDPEPASALWFVGDLEQVADPFAFERPRPEPLPALRAWDRVVREAGASLARDAVDHRLIRQLVEQRGGLVDSQDDVGGWPADPPPRPVPADADRDGMDDAWEQRQRLDPDDPRDGKRRNLRPPYTNLEVYLQELAWPDWDPARGRPPR